MPKRLDPQQAKPFQPIREEFLKGVLDDPAPEAETAVAVAERPPVASRAASGTPPAREERKVVQMPQDGAQAPALPARRGRAPRPELGGERLNRALKVKLAPSERIEFTRIINELSDTFGTALSASHLLRALLTLVRHAEDNIQTRARQHGTLRRPPNDDLTAIAVFEQELAKLLLGALRDAKPLK